MTFDATSREHTTVRRVRTNTPLQALTMLNDEAFFEAARALADRMMREGGDRARDRATLGFRLVTSRAPTAPEVDRVVASYEKQLAHFEADPVAAARAIQVGGDASRPPPATGQGRAVTERAAWTMVANALLNLDEAVTR
jgi:hypothetical protein